MSVTFCNIQLAWQTLARDFFVFLMGLLSLKTTALSIRRYNAFSWQPIQEVAILFAAIFMTIIPALAMLRAGGDGPLAFIFEKLKEPQHYFWITGILSSFLDNAPTYLTFLNTALGNFFAQVPENQAVNLLIQQKEAYLLAISAGAVFMGANTYIGNAPNFLVKSIAESEGIAMPSFLGYMMKYSFPLLLPLFCLISWFFL